MYLAFLCLLTGDGMACDGLPFPDIGCPVPGVGNIYLVGDDECVGYCFYIYPPP